MSQLKCFRGAVPFFGVGAVCVLAQGALGGVADSTWSLRIVQLQERSANADTWVVSDVPVTADTTGLPNGLKIFGTGPDAAGGTTNAVSLTGLTNVSGGEGEFRGMRIIGIIDAYLNRPWDNTVDRITSSFNFDVSLSGGKLDIFHAFTDYGLLDAGDQNLLQLVGSSGYTGIFEPGTSNVSFQYVDGFGGSNADQGVHIVGDFVIQFDWTGAAPTDTLTIDIPQNSLDFQQTPSPAGLTVFGLAGVAAVRRRRA